MNKKVAISVIALFAVALGFGLTSPALADKPVDGVHNKVQVCHFSEAENIFNATGDNQWHNSTAGMVLIDIDNQGQMNGHFYPDSGEPRHGNSTLNLWDFVINSTSGSGQEASDCLPLVVESVGP